MRLYKSKLREDSLSDLTDETIPEKLRDFIMENPFPKDHDQIHAFAEKLGIEADILEQYAYAMLTVIFGGGKSANKDVTISKENMEIGVKIEQEHFAYKSENKVVKAIIDMLVGKTIADHIEEDDQYYLKPKDFKAELEDEK